MSLIANDERPEIDGLRAIACLIVLAFHGLSLHAPQWVSFATGIARLGVWLFFVLSAFLLTMRLLRTGFSLAGMIDYAVARILRIVPLFVLAVLAYHWLDIIDLGPWANVWTALSFQRFYNHLWTIPIEVEFYLLLPFVVCTAAWINRKAGRLCGLASVLLGIVAIVLMFQPHVDSDVASFGKFLACFGFGVAAAFAVHEAPPPSQRTALIGCLASCCAILAFIAVMKTAAGQSPLVAAKHPFFGALFAVLTYSVYSAKTLVSQALSWRPLAAFGLVIYSTYLFHWIPMHYVATIQVWWAIPVAMILSITLGACFYPVEQWLHRWRKPISSFLLKGFGQPLRPVRE